MSVTHDSFTLERQIAASPARVFAAWADPALKRKWFIDSDGPGWEERAYEMDFRVGGGETGRFVLTGDGPDAGEHANATTYLDIVSEARIVYAYTMAMNGAIHSASLATVEFEPAGGGTLVRYTEQGIFFDTSDGASGRKGGWTWLLDALAAQFSESPVA